MSALLDGLIAGYGIAIPLGGISVLIVNLALERGFRLGFMAGAGTATIDMICATLAVFAGAAVVASISPYAQPLQLMSGLVLIAMGVYGLFQIRKRGSTDEHPPSGGREEAWTTYGKFLALTILNPFTVAYFLALIIGKGSTWSFSLMDCIWFIGGVTFASFSWQIVLAGVGAVVRKHLTPRFMKGSIIVGNAIVILLGFQIMISI